MTRALADVRRRSLALAADTFLLAIPAGALASRALGPSESILLWVAVGSGFLLMSMTYFVVGEGSRRGATIGKRLLGIHVADQERNVPIGYKRALVRTAVRMVSGGAVYLGYLRATSDPLRQTWHDLAAHSVVVLDDPSGAASADSGVEWGAGPEAPPGA